MGQSKSASQDPSGFGTRTGSALLVYVIRSILVATACHAQAGGFGATGAPPDCVTQVASSDARPDVVLERWGAFLVGQSFDGVHEAGPASAVASRANRLDLPSSYASGVAARPASRYSLDSTDDLLLESARESGTALTEVTPRPALTDGARGSLVPAEVAHPPSRTRPTGPVRPAWGAISELRGGVLNHDVIFPNRSSLRMPNPFRQRMEGGVNFNAEIIFITPGFLRYLGSPRPRLGGSLNARGYTNNAYLDLDWDHQFTSGPFVEGYLGLAWHDGKLTTGNPERLELGLRVLFHLGLEVGWRFYQHHGLSFMWEHMSNSTLGSRNQGVDSLGLRYGYRFDIQ